MVEKDLQTAAAIRPHFKTETFKHALLEIRNGDSVRSIVVSFSRWKDIENWFRDTGNTSDYVFEATNSGKPHTILRLSRSTSEIRLIELSNMKLFVKSLGYIFFSSIPAITNVVSALLLIAFVWGGAALSAFADHQKNSEVWMEPARTNTTTIIQLFLLIYAFLFVLKAFRIIRDKFYAVREDYELSLIGSLALNAVAVSVIGVIGIGGLISLIKSFLL
ncbi:MAG: hypothetical protein N2484_12330 [Clostridia bacterium]|nr:hypothetical protein [Clostridia bacterium]